MAARQGAKVITIGPEKTITLGPKHEVAEFFGRCEKTESGQFRLQVDRQTKASYATQEAAEEAGLAIKKAYPKLQVVVHDALNGMNKIIELPNR
jgi:hypothetical protein